MFSCSLIILPDVCWVVCSLITSLVYLLCRGITGFFDFLDLLLLMQCRMSLTFCCKDALLTHAQLPVNGNPQVLQSCHQSSQSAPCNDIPCPKYRTWYLPLLNCLRPISPVFLNGSLALPVFRYSPQFDVTHDIAAGAWVQSSVIDEPFKQLQY